ncbi:MAG: hypothetical protein LBJ31_11055 [Treponema sp.]|nr:hypothetical protein [Treponema sp.]
MNYQKKTRVLAGLLILLALVYALTLAFDPARRNERNASFSWLPPDTRDLIDRLEIYRENEAAFQATLKNGVWVSPLNTLIEVPVKQGRVDDLLRLLTTRGAFPLRGSAAASYGELGLGEDGARLVVRGGAGLPLLELIVGKNDSSGEVFLRERGEDSFRSGSSLIASYVNGSRADWYDLKLFGAGENVSANAVQRILVSNSQNALSLARSGADWVFDDGQTASAEKTETWLRSLFESAGEDFIDPASFGESEGRIMLQLGDGSSLTIQCGFPDESGRRAVLAGKPYAYVLPQWAYARLFRERDAFEDQS